MDSSNHAAMEEALHYLQIGRYGQAKSLFIEQLSQDPKNGDVLLLIAHCCSALGENDEGYAYCTQAFAAGQNSSEAYRIMALIQMGRLRYAEAEQVLLDGLSRYPQDVSLISLYASLMASTGFTNKASQLLDDARQIDPTSEEIFSAQFIVEFARFNSKGVENAARMFWEYGGDPLGKQKLLGSSALQRKKFRLAREHYREAFLLDPTDEEVLGILSGLDQLLHPLCWPELFIEKYRRSVIVLVFTAIWLICMFVFGTRSILIVLTIYIGLGIYTAFCGHIYRFYQRLRS